MRREFRYSERLNRAVARQNECAGANQADLIDVELPRRNDRNSPWATDLSRFSLAHKLMQHW